MERAWERKENQMKKSNPALFENPALDVQENKDISQPAEYCEVCFISFGSQEPRVTIKGKTVHLDCRSGVRS